jgi:hypothetical protein
MTNVCNSRDYRIGGATTRIRIAIGEMSNDFATRLCALDAGTERAVEPSGC